MKEHLPEQRSEWPSDIDATAAERELLDRYVERLLDKAWTDEAAVDIVVRERRGSVSLLQRCAQTTAEAMPRLRTLKDLSDYWIEVNRIENEADKLYRRLLSRLYSGEFDALEILKLKEVADQLRRRKLARSVNRIEGDTPVENAIAPNVIGRPTDRHGFFPVPVSMG